MQPHLRSSFSGMSKSQQLTVASAMRAEPLMARARLGPHIARRLRDQVTADLPEAASLVSGNEPAWSRGQYLVEQME